MGRYFGTDGVRGEANVALNAKMAYYIGRYLGQPSREGAKTRILLGKDTRISGDMLSAGLIAGATSSGADVVDLGVTTTPSVSYLVSTLRFDYGVMISASHNPYMDNGIKVFGPTGEKLSAHIEEAIEDYMDEGTDYLPFARGGHMGRHLSGEREKKLYRHWLFSNFDVVGTPAKIICDLANGSATSVVPELFTDLRLKADFIFDKPDGTNINNGCGATDLKALMEAYKEGGYDFGFAYDGDADRFMGIYGDRVLDGDAVIFLSALSLRKHGLLKDDKVVLTVMSNFGLRKALEEEGISYEITPVGDKYVQAALKEKGLSVGGEQSGHVIYADRLNTGDGILTSLKVLDIYDHDRELFDELRKFKVYPQLLVNVRFESRAKMNEILGSDPVKKAIRDSEALLGDKGRLLIRPSGTENLIRVMAEHLDEPTCQKAVNDVVDVIRKA